MLSKGGREHYITQFDNKYDVYDMAGFIHSYKRNGGVLGKTILAKSLNNNDIISCNAIMVQDSLIMNIAIDNNQFRAFEAVFETDTSLIQIKDLNFIRPREKKNLTITMDKNYGNYVICYGWEKHQFSNSEESTVLTLSFWIDQTRRHLVPETLNGTICLYDTSNLKLITTPISISVEKINIPDEFCLYNNYPNPFNPVTNIKFGVPEISTVQISIYNILGQEILTWQQKSMTPGYHSIVWDGKNNNGLMVSSGTYIYTFRAKSESSGKRYHKIQKMMLLK